MSYGKMLGVVALIAGVAVAVLLFIAYRQGSSIPSIPSSVPAQTNTTQSTAPTPVIPSPTPTPPGASAADFTASFYSWYLQGLSSTHAFTNSNTFTSGIGNWLTPAFAAKWASIAADSGADPVLLSQDYGPSWSSNIKTAIVNQTATTATIHVSLGDSTDQQQLDVHLVASGGNWRIDSVTQ